MQFQSIHIFNYTIKNQADDSLDVHIDGEIVDSATEEFMKNWFGDETSTSFKKLRNQVEQTNAKTINLYINSVGGHVGDALAIHDYLEEKESKGVTVNRKGRGIIASAATYLLIGKNSEMSKNSHFLIHNAHSIAYGDVNQMEIQVRNVRKFNDSIVNFYSKKTGKSKDEISNWMNNETWFTAQEAKDAGFIESITGETQFTNKIPQERWEYKNQDVLRIYNSFTNINPINMDIKKLGEAMENHFKNLIEKLGLKDKADDQQVQNAFKEFSDSIINAVKEQQMTDEKVKEIVNGLIIELKLVTEDSLNNKTKDIVNKETLVKELKNNNESLTKDFVKIAGDRSVVPDTEEPVKKGRYSNATKKGYVIA